MPLTCRRLGTRVGAGGFGDRGDAEAGREKHVHSSKITSGAPHPGRHADLRQSGSQSRKSNPENQQGKGALRVADSPESDPDLEHADNQRHPPLRGPTKVRDFRPRTVRGAKIGMSKIGTPELGTARDESVHDIEDSLAQQIPGHDSSHYREGRIRPNQRDHTTSGKKHREQGVRPTPAPCRRGRGEQLARRTDKQDDTEQYRDGPFGCQLELKYRQSEQSPGDPHSQNKPP